MFQHVFALFFRKQTKNYLRFLAFGLLGLALSGCEQDVEIDVAPHTPKLALQYNLNTEVLDQSLFLGRSQSVLAANDLWRNGRVANATITITDGNGNLRQNFIYKQHPDAADVGNYKPVNSFSPVPGQEYTLTVSAPGFATVQGTLTMPAPVPVVTASFQPDSRNSQFTFSGFLRVQFNDMPDQQNFYRMQVRLLDEQGHLAGFFMDADRDSDVLGEDVEKIKLNQVFNDGWARNGVISFSERVEAHTGGNPPVELEITLEHLTKDLFLFERSRENYEEDNPFAEPLNLHSNLKNGYGTFGAITVTKYKIRL